MTLEQAIELLRKYYEKAKKLKYVKDPLAWAFYHVWKKIDSLKTDSGKSVSREGRK